MIVASVPTCATCTYTFEGFLGYATPSIVAIEHSECEEGASSLRLEFCPRLGGGILTVTGTNLGFSDIVLVGASNCARTYGEIDKVTEIQCHLPAGISNDAAVVVIQASGSVTPQNESGSLGYRGCPRKTEPGDASCT